MRDKYQVHATCQCPTNATHTFRADELDGLSFITTGPDRRVFGLPDHWRAVMGDTRNNPSQGDLLEMDTSQREQFNQAKSRNFQSVVAVTCDRCNATVWSAE
ncbi:hypothetical protein [Ruegeria atlantica]|uniref:hypothetical protein n=1 Tax=Ruegeria atlantica TaxID=81569 RepID=UPI00147EDDC4|nr:hypothetical protein [Ruegeria atlantica]